MGQRAPVCLPSKPRLLQRYWVARFARLAWKAGGRPSHGWCDGVEDGPRSKHEGETTMEYYAGIDVALECSTVCVVDGSGKIVREGIVGSEPEPLIGWFGSLGLGLTRVGLEAGPLSQWLYAAIKQAGLAVELLETRHVHDAFSAMPVKSDRNDARGIAQLMRLGWVRPVHCKSFGAPAVGACLTARKLGPPNRQNPHNSPRTIFLAFVLKPRSTTT